MCRNYMNNIAETLKIIQSTFFSEKNRLFWMEQKWLHIKKRSFDKKMKNFLNFKDRYLFIVKLKASENLIRFSQLFIFKLKFFTCGLNFLLIIF